MQNRMKYISTQATFTISTVPCKLVAINVNTAVAASVITVYEAATAVAAKKIAVIDGNVAACHVYAALCSAGLTVVTSGANPDCTITYE